MKTPHAEPKHFCETYTNNFIGVLTISVLVFFTQLAVAQTSDSAKVLQKTVVDTYLTAACQQAYNQIIKAGGASPLDPPIPNAGTKTNNRNGSITYSYDPEKRAKDAGYKNLCGYYVTPSAPEGTNAGERAAYNAAMSAFRIMQSKAMYAGEADIQRFIGTEFNGLWAEHNKPPPPDTYINTVAAAYVREMRVLVGALQPKTAPPQVHTIKDRNRFINPDSPEAKLDETMTRIEKWVNR